ELSKRNVDFVDDFTAIETLETGKRVPACLIVGSNQKKFLQPSVLCVLARHAEGLVVLIGRYEKVRIAFLAGKIGGTGVRADENNTSFGHGLEDRLQNIGKDRSDDEVDLVTLDQSLCLGQSDVGLEFVVLHDHVHLAAAKLAAEIFHRQLDAVAQL